jgi:hypothetical protein
MVTLVGPEAHPVVVAVSADPGRSFSGLGELIVGAIAVTRTSCRRADLSCGLPHIDSVGTLACPSLSSIVALERSR